MAMTPEHNTRSSAPQSERDDGRIVEARNRGGKKKDEPAAAPEPVAAPPTKAEIAYGELLQMEKAGVKGANLLAYQKKLQDAYIDNTAAFSSLGLAIKDNPKLQQSFQISAQDILTFTNATGGIDFEKVGRQAMTAFKPDGQPGKMTDAVDLALRSSGTIPTSIAPSTQAAVTPAPVAEAPAEEVPQEGKRKGIKGAWDQFKKDAKALPDQVRGDFGGEPKAEGQEPARGGFHPIRGLVKAGTGVVGAIGGGIVEAVAPDLGRGGNTALGALSFAEGALNLGDRKAANGFLSTKSVLAGGKALNIVPEGMSMDVLNKVFKIDVPQGRDLTTKDLVGLSADEQKLILHRQAVGKQIESSHENSDAEWKAEVDAAMSQKYNLPPGNQQQITSLTDYVNQLRGQGGAQTPTAGRSEGGTSSTQTAPSGGAATTTQYAAYVGGKQVSADLAVSNSARDKHGDPVILNQDALVRFESAMASHGLTVGKNINVTSSFRTNDEQTALYKSYIKGENPYPVAPPGHSKHQSGFALDIRESGDPKVQAAMKDAGFVRPIPDSDPVHWVYAGPVRKGDNPVLAKA